MITKHIKEKGILAKLLEKGLKILLIKECSRISKIKINIESSSIQILKGILQKIHIAAEDINYKGILFDAIELEATKVKIYFKLSNKELRFRNKPKIKFQLSLSESSIKDILLSNNWNWIGDSIAKKLLNKDRLEDIKIKSNQLLIKGKTERQTFSEEEKFDIRAEEGKVYLENKDRNKFINIPIEDKFYVENLTIKNNLIIVFANSSIDF